MLVLSLEIIPVQNTAAPITDTAIAAAKDIFTCVLLILKYSFNSLTFFLQCQLHPTNRPPAFAILILILHNHYLFLTFFNYYKVYKNSRGYQCNNN